MLVRLATDTLPAAMRQRIERHLVSCPKCRSLLTDFKRLLEVVRNPAVKKENPTQGQPSRAFVQRLKREVVDASRRMHREKFVASWLEKLWSGIAGLNPTSAASLPLVGYAATLPGHGQGAGKRGRGTISPRLRRNMVALVEALSDPLVPLSRRAAWAERMFSMIQQERGGDHRAPSRPANLAGRTHQRQPRKR